jgi:hypothetical protein|tara:strand:+ start:1192 stop:1857 length:666 start_codon:yes stop_codon:yes gene_type:complete
MTFWINDIPELYNQDKLLHILPKKENSIEDNFNAVSRLVIIISVLGLLFKGINYLFSGIFTLALISVYYNYQKKINKETFVDDVSSSNVQKKKKFNLYHPVKSNNPMGNVLLTDITDNPTRKAAPPSYVKKVEEKINDNTKDMIKDNNKSFNKEDLTKKLFKDLGDNYNFEESMINFYSNPATTIPNDQKGFADFCYGDMPSCKEGDDFACAKKNVRHINY